MILIIVESSITKQANHIACLWAMTAPIALHIPVFYFMDRWISIISTQVVYARISSVWRAWESRMHSYFDGFVCRDLWRQAILLGSDQKATARCLLLHRTERIHLQSNGLSIIGVALMHSTHPDTSTTQVWNKQDSQLRIDRYRLLAIPVGWRQ